MTSNPQSGEGTEKTDPSHLAQGDAEQPQFTPEELRKAARAQRILYIVMGIFIILPFIVMWLRRGSGEETEAVAPQIRTEQQLASEQGQPEE